MNFYQKIVLCAILLLACWIRVQGVDRLPDGQFTSNDAYLFASQAQEIAEQGTLPARDMHRWLPHGRDNGQLFPIYAIAYTHKAISFQSSAAIGYGFATHGRCGFDEILKIFR